MLFLSYASLQIDLSKKVQALYLQKNVSECCLCHLRCHPFFHSGRGIHYTYDDHGRLLTAVYEQTDSITYTYDDTGNWLTLKCAVTMSATTTWWEDAEDGDTAGWSIFDAEPAEASIEVAYDDTLLLNVIEFSDSGVSNGYSLSEEAGSAFQDGESFVVQWKGKFPDNFAIIFRAA